MSISSAELARSVTADTLQLTVLPTEACNFRCTYCYETFRHGRMPAGIVTGLKRFLSRRAPALRHLSLSWFGGEPLLAKDIVLDVLDHVATLQQAHPRLRFASDITTNAWCLDRALFAQLLARGVRTYMIAFDGPAPQHDRKRVRADGGPTFARLWDNVCAMREVAGEFDARIRLHVARDNLAHVGEFMGMFAAAFRGDPRFRLMVRELSRLGGGHDEDLPTLEAGAREVIGAMQQEVVDRGLPLFDANAAAHVCHAARANSLLLRADGRVGKCQVALDRDENVVGRLHEDGRLVLEGPRLRPWLRGLLSGDAGELACPAVGWLGSLPEARGSTG